MNEIRAKEIFDHARRSGLVGVEVVRDHVESIDMHGAEASRRMTGRQESIVSDTVDHDEFLGVGCVLRHRKSSTFAITLIRFKPRAANMRSPAARRPARTSPR